MSVASPSLAMQDGTRLVLGAEPPPALSPFTRDSRVDLGLSESIQAGPLAAPMPDGFQLVPGIDPPLALGGFVAGAVGPLRLDLTVSGADQGGRAEMSAAMPLAGDTALTLRLGGEWSGESLAYEPAPFATGYTQQIDLSVTLSHALTPHLFVAGTAAASHETESPAAEADSLLFGASIGLRF